MTVTVPATPATCGVGKPPTANVAAAAGATSTVNPGPAATLSAAAAAVIVVAWSRYNTIVPVATPLVKVSVVAAPNAAPATVGAVTGPGDAVAPAKTTPALGT